MFSGIVETVGTISFLKKTNDYLKITISPHQKFSDLNIGDSVSVNGTCLTVTSYSDDAFNVTVVPETIKLTNLKNVSTGDLLNLERSLKVGDRIGGHYVQGHVDDTGEIVELHADGSNAVIVKIMIPERLTQYIVNKGYIALDGMSITIIESRENWFTVTLIPHTQNVTIANKYSIGTRINLEVDILGKYVVKNLLREKIMQPYIKRVESALNDLRQGKMIILTDHPDRENEGDIIFPAETITPSVINFMIRNCSGIICLSLTSDQLKKIDLNPMVPLHENTSHRGTPFTVSIEAKVGVTTGVSAQDRATTILAAVKKDATKQDLANPGHVFPLHAKEGGVLERPGHTEGSIDIVSLAGFSPAAVLCEVMNPDGTMASGNQLHEFAKMHELKILSIDDIINYRLYHENLISEEVTASLPLEKYGAFQISVIKEKFTGKEHILLTSKKKMKDVPLVRIHSSCITGDLFGSQRCDCNKQLDYSLKKIGEEGGFLIYLNQEGRGIGLFNKIKSYSLQEKGFNTIEANENLGLPVDSREYHLAANILRNRNINTIRLLTNNPLKSSGLEKYGISIDKVEVMPTFCSEHNKNYLRTKKEKLNHIVNFEQPWPLAHTANTGEINHV